MHAVTERPTATPVTAVSVGYKGFHSELDSRCEFGIATYLSDQTLAERAPWETAAARLTLAADIITTHGMSTRHAAARQLLAGYLGVYDRYFRLQRSWRPTPAPASPLTWQNTKTGELLVDIVRTAPPSHPLVNIPVHDRLAQLNQWATDNDATLAGVRILAMSAPAQSLLHAPTAGLTELLGTSFAPSLTTMAGVA